MKIGIDIDGVISDFVTSFRALIKEKFDLELEYDDIREHDLYKVLGISEKEALELIVSTFDYNLDTQPDAIESIKKLAKDHEIVLITARPEETENITKKWLKEKGIEYNKLIFVTEGNKHLTEKEGFDVIIDDHLKEVVRWSEKVPLVYVYNHPWNKSLNIKNNFERVYNWKDILEKLDKHVV